MRILIDTREQAPFTFERFEVETERATLPAGDYSIPGFEDRVAIERKELNDLIACLMNGNRSQIQRELAKLRFYDLTAVVVEASLEDVSKGRYRSEMKPHAALQRHFRLPGPLPSAFRMGWKPNGRGIHYVFTPRQVAFAEIEKRYLAAVESKADANVA